MKHNLNYKRIIKLFLIFCFLQLMNWIVSKTVMTNLLDRHLTLWWKCWHIETHSLLTSNGISTSSRNLLATISRASSGHACSKTDLTKPFNKMFPFFRILLIPNSVACKYQLHEAHFRPANPVSSLNRLKDSICKLSNSLYT